MNRWEYIYTDVNSQYLQHRQERSPCLSPVSLSCTFKSSSTCRQWHTHTHRHIHTQRVCGIKIEWTVWEHGAQQASLVSYFRQDFQWSKHITGHHSDSRQNTYWQSRRKTPKPLLLFADFTSFNVSKNNSGSQYSLYKFLLFTFGSHYAKESIAAEDKWIMPVQKSWQRHSSSNLHTKYLNGEAIRRSNVGIFLHKVAHKTT